MGSSTADPSGAVHTLPSVSESALPASPSPAPGPPALRVLPGGESSSSPRRPDPRVEIVPYDFAASLLLEHELGVSHVLAQILVRRGFQTPAAASAVIEAAETHPAGEFAGIDRPASLIRRHIAAGNRITVHGDYDVDGACSTAVMVRALRALGADVGWFLPNRMTDGYGLGRQAIERLAARGTKLLITVDCGITATAEVRLARAAGIDVVVTDHHAPLASGELPDCEIVHPGVCDYPCVELCGTAVAFKLAQALEAPTADEDIELVGLATVADLMPLRGENRRLAKAGIAALANTSRPGLRALLEVSATDPSSL